MRMCFKSVSILNGVTSVPPLKSIAKSFHQRLFTFQPWLHSCYYATLRCRPYMEHYLFIYIWIHLQIYYLFWKYHPV